MLDRKHYEIFSQAHQMHAEGAQDEKPLEDDIVRAMKDEGYSVRNIDIWFDDLMGFWSWYCDISVINKR